MYLLLSFSSVSSFTFFLLSCFWLRQFCFFILTSFLLPLLFVLINCLSFPPSYCFSSFTRVILLFFCFLICPLYNILSVVTSYFISSFFLCISFFTSLIPSHFFLLYSLASLFYITSQRRGCVPVGFVVDRVALRQVLIRVLRFSPCQYHSFNPLNAELNPICYLLALLGAHHFLHVSRIRVKSLNLMQLMSYIYGAPILDVSRSHTTTHHSR